MTAEAGAGRPVERLGQQRRARPSFAERLFSGSGRIGRTSFIGIVLTLIAALWAYDHVAGGWVRAVTVWLLKPLLFVIGAAAASKRLHDRSRSGWRSAAPLLSFCLAWPEPRGLVGALAVVVLIVCGAELVLLPGARGWNRYGPAGDSV